MSMVQKRTSYCAYPERAPHLEPGGNHQQIKCI